ncbi:hypothetical protein [Fluviicola sp.]|uniref:hypothetical protein n=1 Tax=Fluviicola sp. TaxID=1917219 RepID=UPI0031D96314
MKRFLTGLIVAMGFAAFGQLPYTWTPGVDPGWTSSGALQWRPGCGYVTTNCTGSYANNANTTYTSPSIDASCANASTISVTFTAFGNAEYTYDFMFIYYSLDNGTTWINPYGVGIGWTGNFGSSPGMTIPAITLPTSSNIRFRFNFQSDNSFTYTGYKITDFDIVCNVVLPVEMYAFTGKRMGSENQLQWTTLSENNNDYFEVQWSTNPEAEIWSDVAIVKSKGNSSEKQQYAAIHSNPSVDKKNYYRISQVDKDGTRRTFDEWVVVDDTLKENPLKEVVNIMGQTVDTDTPGLVIYVYEDGTKAKKYN